MPGLYYGLLQNHFSSSKFWGNGKILDLLDIIKGRAQTERTRSLSLPLCEIYSGWIDPHAPPEVRLVSLLPPLLSVGGGKG